MAKKISRVLIAVIISLFGISAVSANCYYELPDKVYSICDENGYVVNEKFRIYLKALEATYPIFNFSCMQSLDGKAYNICGDDGEIDFDKYMELISDTHKVFEFPKEQE